MRAALALVLCSTALAGCRSSSSPPATGSGSAEPVVAPSDAAVVAIDAAPEDLKAHMRKHFAAVSEMQRAIARGHLDDARDLARWLGDHAEPSQDGWEPFVDELQAAARDVVTAKDLPTAAAVAARLGRACGRCHEAREAIVSFSWEPAPEETPMLASQMKRHQWAAARLWEGLVGPADQMWKEGADVLSRTKLDTAQAAEPNRGDVAALAARIRDIAKRAGRVSDQDGRQKLYSELLSTCAGCHQLVRPAPVPGP